MTVSKVRIELRRNPETGKQDLLVDLQSDADLLQFEHEKLHAALVDRLVRKGWNPEQLGRILVTRDDMLAEGRETPIETAPDVAEPGDKSLGESS